MEKKISDHDQASPSSSVSADSSRPSLKIRIRISPKMRKQLNSWDKQQEQVVKEINVKSEVKVKEEEEEVKEINVKSEVVKELIEVHHQPKQELLVDCSTSLSSSFELKLEATKRKFHDSYQQIANAKRQRRIHVILPQPAAAAGGKGRTSSKLAARGTVKSRILNVISSMKKRNRNNLFNASRLTLLKPTYIC